MVLSMDVTVPHNQIFKRIAFFGDAQLPKKDPVYKEAFTVAKLLAQNKFMIVNGGGPGVMDASTQGAEAGGGETIAVTFSPKDAGSFEGRYLKNLAKVEKEVVTDNYIARMFALIENSDRTWQPHRPARAGHAASSLHIADCRDRESQTSLARCAASRSGHSPDCRDAAWSPVPASNACRRKAARAY